MSQFAQLFAKAEPIELMNMAAAAVGDLVGSRAPDRWLNLATSRSPEHVALALRWLGRHLNEYAWRMQVSLEVDALGAQVSGPLQIDQLSEEKAGVSPSWTNPVPAAKALVEKGFLLPSKQSVDGSNPSANVLQKSVHHWAGAFLKKGFEKPAQPLSKVPGGSTGSCRRFDPIGWLQ